MSGSRVWCHPHLAGVQLGCNYREKRRFRTKRGRLFPFLSMAPESNSLLDIEGVTGSIPVTPTIALQFCQ
jgi:hypothetical protein